MKEFLFPVIVLALLLQCGCSDKVEPGSAAIKRPLITGSKAIVIQPSEIVEYYGASGTVKAKNTAVIASKIMGEVTAVHVRTGDRVKAGQLLLSIDNRDITQKVRAAEAGFSEAQKGLAAAEQNKMLMDATLQRYQNLFDEKAMTRQEYDQIATKQKTAALEHERMQEAVKQAKAAVREARVYLDYTQITAPFAGVVTEKKIDPGSMASPGMQLLTIEDDSAFRVEANIDESYADKVKPGQDVEVVIDSRNIQTKGTVAEVVPAVDPSARSFLIKITLTDPGLQSGLFAKVKIPVGTKEAILVPRSAVVDKGQLTGVYVVGPEGIVSYRLVRLGRDYGKQVEVLAGLKGPEKVIVEGADKAVDGGILQETKP